MKFFASALAISTVLLAPNSFAQDCATEECQTELAAQKKAQKKAQTAAALAAEASEPVPFVQDYEPSPAIWKLADKDTTIYMFGTFHILPEGFRWRSDAFNDIVGKADELVVESSEDDSEEAIMEMVMGLVVKAMSPDRVAVSDRLSEANKEKWFTIAEGSEMPSELFDRMPLMLSLMEVGISMAEDEGSLSDYGVETVLEAEFKEAGKPIGSIENSIDVLKAMLKLDENLLVAELDEELSKWSGKDISTLFSETDEDADNANVGEDGYSDVFASEHNWARGIPEKLGVDEFGDTPFGREMYKVLLTDRNRAWAEWLEKRLKKPGTILLAVGAAHFEGEDAVQKMVTERGLYMERIH